MANAEILKKLVKRRGTLKSQITRFKTFIDEYQLQEPDLIKLNIRVERFKMHFADFDSFYDELEIVDEDNDHTTERYDMEENYLDLLSKIEHLKLEFMPNNVANDNIIERNLNSAVAKRRIKLPEASLPKFSGKYEDWLSFKDAFTSMIHNQEDLNNIEKLQYLKSAVTGEAANKIKNLSITDGNYDRAWKLLQSAYADKRLIISRHLSLLLRLPVQDKESAEGLRRLADETQQHLESLKTLDVHVNEEIVVQILEEKMHKLTAEKWEETLKRDTFPRLEEIIEFLYKVASRLSKREREKTEQPVLQSSLNKKLNEQNRYQSQTRKTTRQVFLSHTKKSCPICLENQHPVYKCEKFRNYSIPVRVQAAKDASLCLNCLRNHGDKACTFSKCLICNEAHNTLLHDSKCPKAPSLN